MGQTNMKIGRKDEAVTIFDSNCRNWEFFIIWELFPVNMRPGCMISIYNIKIITLINNNSI